MNYGFTWNDICKILTLPYESETFTLIMKTDEYMEKQLNCKISWITLGLGYKNL